MKERISLQYGQFFVTLTEYAEKHDVHASELAEMCMQFALNHYGEGLDAALIDSLRPTSEDQ